VSWPSVKLSDVLEFHRGITFKPEDKVETFSPSSVVCMRTKNVQEQLDESDIIAVPESFVKRDELYLQEGDLLISSANSWNLVGKVVRIPQLNYRATAGGFISILRPLKQLIDPDYLYRFISSDEQQHKIRHLGRQTTNISNLDRKRFLDLRIPLPPLSIQRKIAAVLEKADNLRQQSQKMEQELNSLAQSVFLDMFGDPGFNQFNWQTTIIEDVVTKVTDGEHSTPQRSAKGVYLLSARNIKAGYIDIDNEKVDFVPESEYQRISKRFEVQEGDIFISCSGTIGRTAINNISDKVCLVRSVAVIRPQVNLVNRKFLEMYLNTDFMHLLMNKVANSSSQKNLFQNQIKKLPVFIPPIELQNEFDSKIQLIDTLKRNIQNQHVEFEENFNSLMQRAFKGELDLKDVA